MISHFESYRLDAFFGGPCARWLATSEPVPYHIPATCTARHTTTVIELAEVLGYTFHATSCASHTATARIGCSPDRHSKYGDAHASHA